jgi:hypothetical protein
VRRSCPVAPNQRVVAVTAAAPDRLDPQSPLVDDTLTSAAAVAGAKPARARARAKATAPGLVIERPYRR